MNDAAAMEIGQAVRDGDEDRDQVVRRHPTTVGEAVGERSAAAELHDEEGLTAGGRVAGVDVEHPNDAPVRGRGEGASLALETGNGRRVVGEVRQQDLDRDVTLEPLVAGSMDGRHAAG